MVSIRSFLAHANSQKSVSRRSLGKLRGLSHQCISQVPNEWPNRSDEIWSRGCGDVGGDLVLCISHDPNSLQEMAD